MAPKLSSTSRTATILPKLKSACLISLGTVCDNQCTVILTKDKLIAAKDKDINIQVQDKDIIMQGNRNQSDGLYDIPITKIQHNNYIQPANIASLLPSHKQSSNTSISSATTTSKFKK